MSRDDCEKMFETGEKKGHGLRRYLEESCVGNLRWFLNIPLAFAGFRWIIEYESMKAAS